MVYQVHCGILRMFWICCAQYIVCILVSFVFFSFSFFCQRSHNRCHYHHHPQQQHKNVASGVLTTFLVAGLGSRVLRHDSLVCVAPAAFCLNIPCNIFVMKLRVVDYLQCTG